jgi:hypothetical protein
LDKVANGFEGQEVVFATGFNHPIDVIEDQMGGLLVADYGTGTVYRISYESSPSTSTTTQTNPNALETYAPEILLTTLIVLIVAIIVLRRRVLKA